MDQDLSESARSALHELAHRVDQLETVAGQLETAVYVLQSFAIAKLSEPQQPQQPAPAAPAVRPGGVSREEVFAALFGCRDLTPLEQAAALMRHRTIGPLLRGEHPAGAAPASAVDGERWPETFSRRQRAEEASRLCTEAGIDLKSLDAQRLVRDARNGMSLHDTRDLIKQWNATVTTEPRPMTDPPTPIDPPLVPPAPVLASDGEREAFAQWLDRRGAMADLGVRDSYFRAAALLREGAPAPKRVVLWEEVPINAQGLRRCVSSTLLASEAYRDGCRDAWAFARAEVERQQGQQDGGQVDG